MDILKLLIPIWMPTSFEGLAVRLKAVIHFMKQSCNHSVTRLVPHFFELVGKIANTFRSPPQRRLRVTACHRFYKTFQISPKALIDISSALSSTTWPTNTVRPFYRWTDIFNLMKLITPEGYGWPGYSGCFGNKRDTASSKRKGFDCGIKAEMFLIQKFRQQIKAFLYQFGFHASSISWQDHL